MKLTTKQKKEIECLDYFSMPLKQYVNPIYKIDSQSITQNGKNISFLENKKGLSPEECYFEITDQGEKDIKCTDIPRLYQLLDAKRWRLRIVDMYEQGILDGSSPYMTILGLEPELKKRKLLSFILRRPIYKQLPCKKVPLCVADFLAKTMFGGSDGLLIKSLYNEAP